VPHGRGTCALEEAWTQKLSWKKWGPYLSERQWGTVREDYSESGDAWNYFSHDQARSRAYRWGEDGLAGISDDRQLLCFGITLWNGQDPILKERLFGLTNNEGNHGEDVKEYYYYLDSTPTHSYMKYLYKYPHAAYPYADLIRTNGARGRSQPEYELLDTGIFDQDRYFDVFVEYAKAAPEDILVQITVHNRGPTAATLHLLPTLWFRNSWSWSKDAVRPRLHQSAPGVLAASHPELGDLFLHADGNATLLFTENETNTERLVNTPNRTPYVKDAFHEYPHQRAHGRGESGTHRDEGSRAIIDWKSLLVASRWCGASGRATRHQPGSARGGRKAATSFARLRPRIFPPPKGSGRVLHVGPPAIAQRGPGERHARRSPHALVEAVLHFDVNPMAARARPRRVKAAEHAVRNAHWHHVVTADVISMPDKWNTPGSRMGPGLHTRWR
jgi:hypothetical protein